ncbi:hypothetical protein GTN27_04405 [Ochrobactrum sp. EEELCW01]|nr:hypothetical protein GTN27_04405 [Ochrobactrum sp. EEELCW01]
MALSPDVLQEAVDLVREHGTIIAASRASGIKRSTLQDRVFKAKAAGLFSPVQPIPGFEISRYSSTVRNGQVVSESIQQKPAEAMGRFNVPGGHYIKGVSALVDADGNVKQQWLKTGMDPNALDIVEAVRDVISDYAGASHLIPEPDVAHENTFTVIPLPDWHIGLMAWARETGENYDLKIARETIMQAMVSVINQSPPSSHAIILGLGDMLHFDGYEPVTSRSGNFLDADGRYPKVLRTALDMVRSTVDLALQKFRTVEVRILPGNHDDQSAVALSLAFSLFYENNERVTFDDSPSRFWWKRIGKVFLGATHGDKTKMRDLPLVMAADNPHDWADSTYRRIYCGHIHHESAIEEGGVLVTSLRSPVAKDAYHSFSKYRSGRSVYSDTYDVSGRMASSVKVNL